MSNDNTPHSSRDFIFAKTLSSCGGVGSCWCGFMKTPPTTTGSKTRNFNERQLKTIIIRYTCITNINIIVTNASIV